MRSRSPAGVPPAAQPHEDDIIARARAGQVELHELNLDDPTHAEAHGIIVELQSKRPVFLMLHATDAIPGDSLPIAVNGRKWYIPTKRWVRVPAYVVEVLENSIAKAPERDENDKIVGFMDTPTYNFLVSETEPSDKVAKDRGITDLYPKRV